MKPFVPAQEVQPRPAMAPPKPSTTGSAALAALTPDRGGSGSRSRQQRPARQDGDTEPGAASPNPATTSLALLLAKLDLDALG